MFNNDKSANEIIEKMKQVDINDFTDVIPVSRGLLETAIAVALSDRDALHESRRKSCVGAMVGAVPEQMDFNHGKWQRSHSAFKRGFNAARAAISFALAEWEKSNP